MFNCCFLVNMQTISISKKTPKTYQAVICLGVTLNLWYKTNLDINFVDRFDENF